MLQGLCICCSLCVDAVLLGSFISVESLPTSLKDAIPDHPLLCTIPFILCFSLLALYCPRHDIFVYCQPRLLGCKFQEGFWWLCILLYPRPQTLPTHNRRLLDTCWMISRCPVGEGETGECCLLPACVCKAHVWRGLGLALASSPVCPVGVT